jgi:hypothetical protein
LDFQLPVIVESDDVLIRLFVRQFFRSVSNIDQRLPGPEMHAGSITAPAIGIESAVTEA